MQNSGQTASAMEPGYVAHTYFIRSTVGGAEHLTQPEQMGLVWLRIAVLLAPTQHNNTPAKTPWLCFKVNFQAAILIVGSVMPAQECASDVIISAHSGPRSLHLYTGAATGRW